MLGRPLVASRMLAGLTSRWIRPARARRRARRRPVDERERVAPGRARPLAREQLAQVGALDVAHRDEQRPVRLAGLEDGDDVRVVERGRELRLTQEPGPELAVLGERWERAASVPPCDPAGVVSEVDDAHPATTEQPVDPVAGQYRPDPRIRADAHWFAPQRLAPYGRMVKTTVYEHARGRVRPRPIIPLIEGKGSPPNLAERDEEYLAAGIGQG